MKNRPWLIAIPFFLCCSAPGPRYTLANAHSHNDYEQPIPFWTAYNAQFGSIEADIFLVDGRLMVAHDRKELALDRTLEEYYVKPLSAEMEKHHGHPYTDSTRQLHSVRRHSPPRLSAGRAFADRDDER